MSAQVDHAKMVEIVLMSWIDIIVIAPTITLESTAKPVSDQLDCYSNHNRTEIILWNIKDIFEFGKFSKYWHDTNSSIISMWAIRTCLLCIINTMVDDDLGWGLLSKIHVKFHVS